MGLVGGTLTLNFIYMDNKFDYNCDIIIPIYAKNVISMNIPKSLQEDVTQRSHFRTTVRARQLAAAANFWAVRYGCYSRAAIIWVRLQLFAFF